MGAVNSNGYITWSDAWTFSVEAVETHICPGGFPNASHLDFWVDDGGDPDYGNKILQVGSEIWNGISSNVYVHRDWQTSFHHIGIVKTDIPMAYYGIQIAYDENNNTVWIDEPWYRSIIYIYDDLINSDGGDDDNKISIVAHEMGHCLSLRHTCNDDYNPDIIPLWTEEIMDLGLYLPKAPTDIDKYHLRVKWGE